MEVFDDPGMLVMLSGAEVDEILFTLQKYRDQRAMDAVFSPTPALQKRLETIDGMIKRLTHQREIIDQATVA